MHYIEKLFDKNDIETLLGSVTFLKTLTLPPNYTASRKNRSVGNEAVVIYYKLRKSNTKKEEMVSIRVVT